ncbi:hypothetical protein AHGSH82_014150 [Aeromonas hydrophila]|nr:hypothetical protein AHGSH82_014150 [Aeromonas hydrophila]
MFIQFGYRNKKWRWSYGDEFLNHQKKRLTILCIYKLDRVY